jgi:hypothetical protein
VPPGATIRGMAHAVRTINPEFERSRAEIRYAWGILADAAPGRSLVDELIADHRAEAHAEDERQSDPASSGGRG